MKRTYAESYCASAVVRGIPDGSKEHSAQVASLGFSVWSSSVVTSFSAVQSFVTFALFCVSYVSCSEGACAPNNNKVARVAHSLGRVAQAGSVS